MGSLCRRCLVISDVVEIAIIFQRLKFLPSYEFLHLSGLDFASGKKIIYDALNTYVAAVWA